MPKKVPKVGEKKDKKSLNTERSSRLIKIRAHGLRDENKFGL